MKLVKELDLRMNQFEIDEQKQECFAILKQTEANLKALSSVKLAMIERLQQLEKVVPVKMTKRQRAKRDEHNNEVKALKALKSVMNDKGNKLDAKI